MSNRSRATENNAVLNTIRVGNLPVRIREKQVRQFFTDAGAAVTDVQLTWGMGGNPSVGHVEFATSQDTERALKLNGWMLDGSCVNISLVRSRPLYIRGFGLHAPAKKIHANLLAYFTERCGKVTSLILPSNPETGLLLGYAVVEFATEEALRNALYLDQTHGCDGILTVKVSKEMPVCSESEGIPEFNKGLSVAWSHKNDGKRKRYLKEMPVCSESEGIPEFNKGPKRKTAVYLKNSETPKAEDESSVASGSDLENITDGLATSLTGRKRKATKNLQQSEAPKADRSSLASGGVVKNKFDGLVKSQSGGKRKAATCVNSSEAQTARNESSLASGSEHRNISDGLVTSQTGPKRKTAVYLKNSEEGKKAATYLKNSKEKWGGEEPRS